MTHRTPGRLHRQVESVQRHFANAPGLPFSEVLTAEQVAGVLQDAQVTFAERLYTPLVTLWVWLTQVIDPDHSLRQAVARFLAWRVGHGQAPCSADTGAFAKARQRLPERVFAELTRRTGRDLVTAAPARWTWHGRDVKIADGSTVSMPDTPANQNAYPQPAAQARPGFSDPALRRPFFVGRGHGAQRRLRAVPG